MSGVAIHRTQSGPALAGWFGFCAAGHPSDRRKGCTAEYVRGKYTSRGSSHPPVMIAMPPAPTAGTWGDQRLRAQAMRVCAAQYGPRPTAGLPHKVNGRLSPSGHWQPRRAGGSGGAATVVGFSGGGRRRGMSRGGYQRGMGQATSLADSVSG